VQFVILQKVHDLILVYLTVEKSVLGLFFLSSAKNLPHILTTREKYAIIEL